MITKIELTNFKSHAHTVIEPGRVTFEIREFDFGNHRSLFVNDFGPAD